MTEALDRHFGALPTIPIIGMGQTIHKKSWSWSWSSLETQEVSKIVPMLRFALHWYILPRTGHWLTVIFFRKLNSYRHVELLNCDFTITHLYFLFMTVVMLETNSSKKKGFPAVATPQNIVL